MLTTKKTFNTDNIHTQMGNPSDFDTLICILRFVHFKVEVIKAPSTKKTD